jgi:NitT/TauT family transport system substrate-binding protein
VKRIVTTYTKMTPDMLKEMVLPVFNVDFNKDAMKKLGEATAKYGTISKAPDLSEMLP